MLTGLDKAVYVEPPQRRNFLCVIFYSVREKGGKCSDLLLCYVGVRTFKNRCSFNEFASVHRDYILKRAI